MGAPARAKDPETGKMKAVPGCNIFVGGKIGEDAYLSCDPYKKGVPLAEDSIVPELVEIIKEKFGGERRRKRDTFIDFLQFWK